MTINIREKAKELIPIWKKKGFNSIRFVTLELQGSDLGEPDEQTPEEVAEFNKNYVTFLAQPDFPSCDVVNFPSSPYVEVVTNYEQFYDDFKAELKKQFGDDILIDFHDGCYEWEIRRPT